MKRLVLLTLALSYCGFITQGVFALGSDHPEGLVAGNDRWPAGLKDLVNRKDRVHGYWVNETDVFFYDGDTTAFNQFMSTYNKLKNTALEVVIHPGVKKARSPWDKAERDIPVAWSLHASFSPLDELGAQRAGGGFYTRVDIWLGSRVNLDELRIPASVRVVSGGEIEKFIAERKGQKKK